MKIKSTAIADALSDGEEVVRLLRGKEITSNDYAAVFPNVGSLRRLGSDELDHLLEGHDAEEEIEIV